MKTADTRTGITRGSPKLLYCAAALIIITNSKDNERWNREHNEIETSQANKCKFATSDSLYFTNLMHKFFILIHLLHSSTCFEHYYAHLQ